jgi:presenilin-like A22 family membrane protease
MKSLTVRHLQYKMHLQKSTPLCKCLSVHRRRNRIASSEPFNESHVYICPSSCLFVYYLFLTFLSPSFILSFLVIKNRKKIIKKYIYIYLFICSYFFSFLFVMHVFISLFFLCVYFISLSSSLPSVLSFPRYTFLFLFSPFVCLLISLFSFFQHQWST